MAPKDYPLEYFTASGLAALLNFPLWRVSAIGQSGFAVEGMTIAGMAVPKPLAPYVHAFQPPYKGAMATVFGMTWARALIFYGSDAGKAAMMKLNYDEATATVAPTLILGTFVQVANMPLVRGTIQLQDPKEPQPNVRTALIHLYRTRGLASLWHGTSAAVLKTVPKYCIAVAVKDYMEEALPAADNNRDRLIRSAVKSIAAGVAGAALTNPLDVIRNEMFKTHQNIFVTCKDLYKEMGWSFMTRGLGKNVIAVSLPVAMTIFFTDVLVSRAVRLKEEHERK